MDLARNFALDVGPDEWIHCIDTGGDGPPVVILHGLAGSSREFFASAGALPEFRMLLIDLRGHGNSTRTPSDLSREAFVADVVQVIQAAVGAPAVLAGQSMGGHTAMLVAAPVPFPDREAARAYLGDGPLPRAWVAD